MNPILATIAMFAALCTSAQPAVYPPSLKEGDKIAILSPSGPIDPKLIDSAAQTLSDYGFEPVVYPHAKGHNGHFSGQHSERLQDMVDAFSDPQIRAILCSRGGYGAVHSLDSLIKLPLEADPKWVIGYSDISALHALMASKNIASVHASMAKQLALGTADSLNNTLINILRGEFPSYTFAADPRNHPGTAKGKLVGGNLAVIADLIATPIDIIQPGTILFIEDIAEPIYKVERIIYQLKLMGIFPKLKGLVIGQFTDYRPDGNHSDMYDMISEALAEYPELPVAFGAPIGHVDFNVPVVESAQTTLEITPEKVTLKMEK